MSKHALLIAGGGTIGSYVSKELLALGHTVDVICLEDHASPDPRLRFYRASATLPYLTEFLAGKHYSAIVNFLHYETAEDYRPYHELLSAHTDQLVFLSSYRVYADRRHPITESAALLSEAIQDDPDFLATETYAMGKLRCERYLREESKTKNWTILRPVISFAGKRFDLLMYNNVLEEAKEHAPVLLPEGARRLVAGLDWAGNVGKLIAHLLFRPECLGETYTVTSGAHHTWEEIAAYYTELAGISFEWIPTEEYIARETPGNRYRLIYDRLWSRDMDASKILAATHLTPADFLPLREAIRTELLRMGYL